MAEFNFALGEIFQHGIVAVRSDDVKIENKVPSDYIFKVGKVIDQMGLLSAKAQNLVTPITSLERFLKTSDQTIYFIVDLQSSAFGQILGFLKVGRKDLYLYDDAGNSHQAKQTPVVLDFFVHDKCQRQGYGKRLYDYMLAAEKIDIGRLCIDRPSDKMVAFLKKNYNLTKPIYQLNFFMMYKEFFEKKPNETQQGPSSSSK